MHIGVLRIELFLGESLSLKQKRGMLRRVKDRLRNTFNVSVAEVGHLDKWQRAVIGVVTISTDKKHLSSRMDRIMDFIEGQGTVSVLDHTTEIL
ncbi:MAG: DUF503 family protein [Candidatus Omnitrophica bacterium]|nr:DUF503 family protein [Candidatus Omnitrophota bacterium]